MLEAVYDAQEALWRAIGMARAAGSSWEDIGATLGLTAEHAHYRYAAFIPREVRQGGIDPLGGSVETETCLGRLVVHQDSSFPPFCTLEESGGCVGLVAAHPRGQMSCWLASPTGGCEICGAGPA